MEDSPVAEVVETSVVGQVIHVDDQAKERAQTPKQLQTDQEVVESPEVAPGSSNRMRTVSDEPKALLKREERRRQRERGAG